MNDKTCETCRFWSVWEHRDGYEGECRRNAPRPVMYSQTNETDPATDALAHWPLTRAEDWCGDHQPKTFRSVRAEEEEGR